MDVDIAWRRKRPIEEEEYQEKKRFLSEEFFNMRISHSREAWMGKPAGGTRAEDVVIGDHDEAMEDQPASFSLESLIASASPVTQSTSASPAPLVDNGSSVGLSPSAAVTVTSSDEDTEPDEFDVDTPAPRLSRREPAGSGSSSSLPHPLQRPSASPVDEKVEEWVRQSRHRLMAEASVDSGPDLCRALIVYNPLPLPGSANAGDEEAGGDPSSSPSDRSAGSSGERPTQTSVDPRGDSRGDGDEVQCAGSSTSESKPGKGGGGDVGLELRKRGAQGRGDPVHPADDGAGAMLGNDDTDAMSIEEDAMEAIPSSDGDGLGPWQGTPAPPTLTRVGTSRGPPTPNLSPEWVTRVRNAAPSMGQSQEPGEEAAGPGVGNTPSEGWGRW